MASVDIGKDNVFVYFAHVSGRLIPAPDSRMRPEQCGLNPVEWKRCEAAGAREIEKVSIILSRQEWEGRKARHVQMKLREMEFLKQRAVSARLRRATGFSPKDVAMNEKLEKRWRRKEDEAIALIVSEFDPAKRDTALSVELRDAPVVPHHLGQKSQGVLV